MPREWIHGYQVLEDPVHNCVHEIEHVLCLYGSDLRQHLFVNAESLLIRVFHPDHLCYVNATLMQIPRITGTLDSAMKDAVTSCQPGYDLVVGDVPGCGICGWEDPFTYVQIFVSHQSCPDP
jgi:hypothetical protein